MSVKCQCNCRFNVACDCVLICRDFFTDKDVLQGLSASSTIQILNIIFTSLDRVVSRHSHPKQKDVSWKKLDLKAGGAAEAAEGYEWHRREASQAKFRRKSGASEGIGSPPPRYRDCQPGFKTRDKKKRRASDGGLQFAGEGSDGGLLQPPRIGRNIDGQKRVRKIESIGEVYMCASGCDPIPVTYRTYII